MNRNSKRAQQLVILLSKAAIRVSTRRLEKLSQKGLLPLDGSSDSQVAAHFEVLVEAYRGGPEAADRAAFALAYRGFGCARLRDAIVRELHPQCKGATDLAAQLEAATPDLVDAQSDEGLAEIEAAVNWMESDKLPRQLRGIVSFIVDMFRPENGVALKVIDPVTYWATDQPETPEQLSHSYLTNMIAAGIGDGIYDDTAIMAVLGKADEDAPVLAIPSAMSEGGLYRASDQALVGASVQQLVAGTLLGRAVVSYIPYFSDEQRVTVAAATAPCLIALFDRILDSNPTAAGQLLAGLAEVLNGLDLGHSGGELVTSA
jgi:hypothetical protein